jgi:putative ABC transport system permease protein
VFTERDVAEVRRLPDVADISLRITGLASFRAGGWHAERVTTIATLANGLQFEHLDLVHGRFFVNAEASRDMPVVVVSVELAKTIAGLRPYPTVLGTEVRVGGTPRRVIGIFGGEDEVAYVPLRAASDVFGVPPAPQMLVRARAIERVEPVRAALEDWAAVRFGPPDEMLDFATYENRIQQATQGIAVFKLIMGAIIGISLLVGGIGVMNVLLASVAERTREIGLRRALGARRRHILAQFLFESLAITGLGSVFGILLGSVGSMAMSPLVRSMTGQPITVVPTLGTLLIAVASPALVGLVFGIYPARRAARLSPIDALRHE